MKKLTLIAVAALVFTAAVAFLAPSVALAQQTVTEPRCTVAKARIQNLATTMTQVKEQRLKIYNGIAAQTDALVTSAETAGYDVTALKASRDNVQASIATYSNATTAYETALSEVQQAACEQTDTAYLAALTDARTKLVATRTAQTALRSAVLDEVVPALRAYASWLGTQENA